MTPTFFFILRHSGIDFTVKVITLKIVIRYYNFKANRTAKGLIGKIERIIRKESKLKIGDSNEKE